MPETLKFIHISDTHITTDTTYIKSYADYTPILGAEALVQAINDLPFTPDFVLHTGDVAYDPVPEEYPMIAALMAKIKAPIYYIAGNHDDMGALQKMLIGAEDIQPHLHYDFEVKGVHFVCVDSNGPHDPEKPSGSVPQEQLEWLDEICTSDDERPLVIAIHHNVIPVGVPWLDDWMRLENGEEFHRIVKQARDRLRGVFYGHIHQNIQTLRDGVLYVSAASSWCQFMSYPIPENEQVSEDKTTPPGFNIVTIQDNQTYIRQHTFSVKA